MSPQTVSIRTRCTYTYRPITPSLTPCLTPSSSTASSPIDGPTSIKITKSSRKPRRSNRNIAWPSKQCHKNMAETANLSAGLEGYLMLLEQQRDAVASRCSSVASGAYSRENTPVSLPE